MNETYNLGESFFTLMVWKKSVGYLYWSMEQSLCGPQNIWGMEAKDSLEDSIRPSMTLLSGSQARDVTLGTLSVNTRGLPCLTNQTYMYDQLSDSALLARWLPDYIQSTK